MSKASTGIFIIGAKRTPFGAFGGKLKNFNVTQLSVIASQAALAQARISGEVVDETFIGSVIHSSTDAAYLSRHVALKSNVPIKAPSLTINRLCGSGFEAVCLGAESIILGRSNITLCGGAENMSGSPMVIDGISSRWGIPLGKGLNAQDSLWTALTDSHVNLPMGKTAENLAAKYGITREQCDEFALRSQNLWQKANDEGNFNEEIIGVSVKGKKGPEQVTVDEHPRKDLKLEDLTRLKTVFDSSGVVTAGNASGINDGAASIIVASEQAVKSHGLTPLSRIVSWSRVGCDPTIMGIGPVEAIRKTVQAAGLTLADIDIVEINEAFAAQYLACEKELQLDRTKANQCGGAIAIGHPLGASGARIVAHMTHALLRTKKKYAIGAACIGGGQGIAVLLENAQL